MKLLCAIVGMRHRGTERVVAALPKGHPLLLVRDRENPHDPNAVQVWANDQHVGFVKATQVRDIARKLDSPAWRETSKNTGLPCMIGALSFDGGRWPMVEVEV